MYYKCVKHANEWESLYSDNHSALPAKSKNKT